MMGFSDGGWCPACGARFRTAAGEARHRHNFPRLCRPVLKTFVFSAVPAHNTDAKPRRVTMKAPSLVGASVRARSELDHRVCRCKSKVQPLDWVLTLVEESA